MVQFLAQQLRHLGKRALEHSLTQIETFWQDALHSLLILLLQVFEQATSAEGGQEAT